MLKRMVMVLAAIMALLTGIMLSACDPGIYSFGGESFNPFAGMDISQFLDPKTCYTQLLKDLEYMRDKCYFDESLASAQAYTILMSYGLADKSKESSLLSQDQLNTKASLFSQIKLINIYANTFSDSETVAFYPLVVFDHTLIAINYCKQMLEYF